MADLRDFCERLWNGEIDTVFEAHPVATPWNDRQPEEIVDGVLYFKGVSSVNTIDIGDSLVMIDSGTRNDSDVLYEAIRRWRPDHRLDAVIFSHHHLDHVFGVGPFEAEADERRLPRPVVYGHAGIARNFDRYKKTRGWNAAVNRRQFAREDVEISARGSFPADFRYPDVTFHDRLTFKKGDHTFELGHARSQTEDTIWTWIPERRILAPGDLFVWAVPNAGNPQKAQRWVGEWAAGMREMAGLGAELMLPGHGFPIFGADRIRTALSETADFLESIEAQVLALMNTGATLDRVLHEVEIPADPIERPFMRPVYDHPEFLIRNVWRQYGGWYTGEPDELLPAPRAAQAREWVGLAGGLEAVLERASALRDDGNLRLASHLVEYAVLAEPDSKSAHELRAEVYSARAALETSSMARGILGYAAQSSRSSKRDGFA